jgi:hypothetical protein
MLGERFEKTPLEKGFCSSKNKNEAVSSLQGVASSHTCHLPRTPPHSAAVRAVPGQNAARNDIMRIAKQFVENL